MITRRSFILGAASAVVVTGGIVTLPGFREAIAFHRKRVSHGSSLIASAFGNIEYTVAGSGSPALMIHGSGGGFDQGIDNSRPLQAAGFEIIAPSRFGYLRSSNPASATPEMQADAYVALLNHLKLERVAVIGISAGAVSAMQFAARHPQRCSALALVVPAATAAGPDTNAKGPTPGGGPVARALVTYAVKSDFLFWLGCRFAPRRIYGSVLATDPDLIAAASSAERMRAETLMWNILPISARSEGLANDVRFTSTPLQIDLKSIAVPTLAISFEDDLYGTAATARYIAAAVPGARSVIYPRGGHVYIEHEADVFREIETFFQFHPSQQAGGQHADQPTPRL